LYALVGGGLAILLVVLAFIAKSARQKRAATTLMPSQSQNMYPQSPLPATPQQTTTPQPTQSEVHPALHKVGVPTPPPSTVITPDNPANNVPNDSQPN
jgi:cytoskeletal protein RodZ